MNTLSRGSAVISWLCQIGAAVILAQTLFFKLTWAPETQWIFGEKLGVGRAGATATALIELACAILLLLPRSAALGAVLTLLTMGGAIASHLTILGIESRNPATGEGDGGLLFALAIGVAVAAAIVIAIRRNDLFALAASLRTRLPLSAR